MSQRFLQVHVEQPPCCDVEGWSQTRWTQQSFNWLRVYPESFNLSVSPLCPEQFMCFLYWRNPFLQMQCWAYLKSDSICGFRVYQINMCYIARVFCLVLQAWLADRCLEDFVLDWICWTKYCLFFRSWQKKCYKQLASCRNTISLACSPD